MNFIPTRAEIKTRAKESLKGNYWYAFGVSILASIVAGIVSGILSAIMQLNPESYVISTLCSFLNILALLFISLPLSIGLMRYYLNLAKGETATVSDLTYAYKANLGNILLTLIKEVVFVFLWSLLFIIPGIIKAYQYFMIDYMIADNPDLDRKRAFEITKAAMRGNKWRTFVLGLSFILWILLCVVTCGIGFLFLDPYVQATYSHYYLELKKNAIEAGIATAEELNG